jgi:hypothetical protein
VHCVTERYQLGRRRPCLGVWAADGFRFKPPRNRYRLSILPAPIATAIGSSVSPNATRFSTVCPRNLLPPRLLDSVQNHPGCGLALRSLGRGLRCTCAALNKLGQQALRCQRAQCPPSPFELVNFGDRRQNFWRNGQGLDIEHVH